MSDLASTLRDELTCPLCLSLFDDPRILSCGHTFCAKCIKDVCTLFINYLENFFVERGLSGEGIGFRFSVALTSRCIINRILTS